MGGVKSLEDGSFATSSEIYLLKNDSQVWEKIEPEVSTAGGKVPQLQGQGMIYNPETKSIWIMAGGFGSPVQLADVTYELSLPGVVSENWYFNGRGCREDNYYPVFEPLAFVLPGDKSVYLYGGIGKDRGGGEGVYSTDLWKISQDNTNIVVEKANWPLVDYGGGVRGGFDIEQNQLVLHAGHPTFFLGYPYQETVEYDKTKNEWFKLSSLDPKVVDKPAVAMNLKTGEMLRFGGSYYDENHSAVWSDETWVCKPIHKTSLPIVANS
jgi:hypothetical protein